MRSEQDENQGHGLPTRAGAARDETAEPAPERIGPYRVLQKLGEGGMGVVYLAEQAAPVQRRVAIKLIKLGMDTREVVARFETERQALALMNHPNVAAVYDAGATDRGRPYFVMEHVPGVPITQYCDTHRLALADRLEPEAALEKYEKALEIRARIVQADPANLAALGFLALSHERVGNMLLKLGRTDAALEHFHQCLDAYRRRLALDPSNADSVEGVAIALEKLADVAMALGRTGDAIEQLRESVRLTEQISADPSDADAQRGLAVAYYKLAAALTARGGGDAAPAGERVAAWREARLWFEKALAQLTVMRERGTLASYDERMFDRIAENVASCDAALAELNAAATQPADAP
jgi:tetratricopeptide (TPR) repeat protein